MSKPMDARARRTAGALQDALLKLLNDKPMEQITVREIAATADINYATFFRHHGSKAELLQHLAADEMQRLVDITVPVFDTVNIEAANRALFDYVGRNRRLWSALLTGGAADTMRKEQLRLSREVGVEPEEDNARIPFDLRLRCTVNLIFETLVWWLDQPEGDYPEGEAAAILTQLIKHRVEPGAAATR